MKKQLQNRAKLVEAIRYLEVAHNTQQFSRAISNVLMEMAEFLSFPTPAFKKFGKPKNYEAMNRSANRMRKFLDPIIQ